MAAQSLFSLDNQVFRAYLTYGGLLVAKMMTVALFTGMRRVRKNAFLNPEDFKAGMGDKYTEEKAQELMKKGDPVVERYLRIHRNDLENIPSFLLIGLMYVAIDPTVSTALWHFRIFCIARYLHYISYGLAIPQPARGLSFFVGQIVTGSLVVQVIRAAFEL